MSDTLLVSRAALGPLPGLHYNEDYTRSIVYPAEVTVTIVAVDPSVGMSMTAKFSPNLEETVSVSIETNVFQPNYQPQSTAKAATDTATVSNIVVGFSETDVVEQMIAANRYVAKSVSKPPLTLTTTTSVLPTIVQTQTTTITEGIDFVDSVVTIPRLFIPSADTTVTIVSDQISLDYDADSYDYFVKIQGINDSQQITIEDQTLPTVGDIALIAIVDESVGTNSPANQLMYTNSKYVQTTDATAAIQQDFELSVEPATRQIFKQLIQTESQIKWSQTLYTTDTAFAVVNTATDAVADSELDDADLTDNLQYPLKPVARVNTQTDDSTKFFTHSELYDLLPLQMPYYYTQIPGFVQSRITIFPDISQRSASEIYLTDIKVVTVSQTQTSISVGYNVQQIWF
jgi:hypothetical protein